MKGQQIWSHLVFKAFFGARIIWSQGPCIECHQHANCFLIWAMCGDPSRKIPQHASWVVMEDPHHWKGIFTRKDSQASGKKIQFNKQGGYANTMHLSNSSLSLIADQYFSSIQSKGTQPGGSHSNRLWQGRLRHKIREVWKTSRPYEQFLFNFWAAAYSCFGSIKQKDRGFCDFRCVACALQIWFKDPAKKLHPPFTSPAMEHSSAQIFTSCQVASLFLCARGWIKAARLRGLLVQTLHLWSWTSKKKPHQQLKANELVQNLKSETLCFLWRSSCCFQTESAGNTSW